MNVNPADATPPALRITDLTLEFGPIRALDHVGFEVPTGSVTGLVGRNGAGKSTSIRCIAGILRPRSGDSSIEVFGLSPDDARAQVLARSGFLLSEPALFPYLTPAEILAFLARAYGVPPDEAAMRVEDLLRFFDLTGVRERLIDNFSTGMRKRLALCAAMIHSPPLLVLDEPFESLDPLMVRALKKLLVEYARGGGTVLLSSHLIDAVEEICDRVVILEQGRVVASGETGQVKASIATRLPSATLEDLYASLVPSGDTPDLNWLTNRGKA